MNKLRCLCFKAINRLYGKTEDITNYINELEQQKAELMETLDIAIDILSDCNYNFILGKEVLEKYK